MSPLLRFHLLVAAAAALFPLPLLMHAQPSRSPSTTWPLSDLKYLRTYNIFTICNNGTSYPVLLNDNQGLYGRCTNITSVHQHWPYTVYFRLCFVAGEEGVCMTSGASYYLSMVATNKTPDKNRGQIIWTANTGKPVSKDSCLQFGDDKNLKLVEYGNGGTSPQVVWESNTKLDDGDAKLAITSEGDMVLFRNRQPFERLWKSSEQPTDTLMVLQVLRNYSTLTARNNAYSRPPNSGNYTMVIENRCLKLYARIGQQRGDQQEESPYGSPYWVWCESSGEAEAGIKFIALCWYVNSPNQLQLVAGFARSESAFVTDSEIPPTICSSLILKDLGSPILRVKVSDAATNVTYATFMRLDADGDLRAYTVNDTTYHGNSLNDTSYVDTYANTNNTAVWTSFYSVFEDMPCQLPLYCGFYGKCDDQQNRDNLCSCDSGFESIDASNSRLGCKLEFGNLPPDGSVCASYQTNKIGFVTLENVHYFSVNFTDPHDKRSDRRKCQNSCQQDCNCTAAFLDDGSRSCFLIRGQVGTIRNGNMVAFIKYVYVDPFPSHGNNNWQEIGPVLAVVTVTLVVACIYLYKRRRTLEIRYAELEKERLLLSLLSSNVPERFKWKQMRDYTCGFCNVLGGGAFGRVFRGSLPDGTAIAVKQLDEDRSHGQGDKEFIAEVSILSRIQHAHLVRLIGFCLEGAHRLLVYELMENGSLELWLFKSSQEEEEDKGKARKEVLSWKTRFQIALGTSKGLAYLHEELEERVIHMDLKPQNILLDRDFTPKISDFGLSRRADKGQSAVMTVMRGTPGYLAPEWLLDCAVTQKCDVYSFGVVLLELVSGRKVRDLRELKQKLSMRSRRESVMLELLDNRLTDCCGSHVEEEEEMVRMVEVALLCVRRDPAKRPSMSSVVLMLEGKVEVKLTAIEEEEEDDDDWEYGDHEDEYATGSKIITLRSKGSTSTSSALNFSFRSKKRFP